MPSWGLIVAGKQEFWHPPAPHCCAQRGFHGTATEVKCKELKIKPENLMDYFCLFHARKSKLSPWAPLWVTTTPCSPSTKIWQESWVPSWWIPGIISITLILPFVTLEMLCLIWWFRTNNHFSLPEDHFMLCFHPLGNGIF